MVRIRLKRFGRRHRPCYRLAAVDIRSSRDGAVIEELGSYDPANQNPEQRCLLKKERIEYWLQNGAQPSDTARGLLTKSGIQVAARK